jgi:flagellar hook-associated protein 1 FlgK
MGGITAALLNSANALDVFSRTFQVIENNITNANTPGYAKQDQLLLSLPFNQAQHLNGGVALGPVLSSRDEFLEQAVRTQQQALGDAQQRAADLGQIQPLFDLTSKSGLSDALSGLFSSFSQLSVSPNEAVSRQAVINAAGQLASSIRATSSGINQVSTNVGIQTNDVVSQINAIATQIAQINAQFQSSAQAQQDPGLDAQLHNNLENLSQLTDFSIIKGSGGAITIAVGGQTPLVIGSQTFNLAANTAAGQTTILDGNGNDITSQITQGKLGALIQENNTTIPSYLTDLNRLAQSVADSVNSQLAQGLDRNANAPTTPLFSYDAPNDAASTISVNNLTPDQIGAAATGAPGGNGNAVALAQLESSPQIDGFTFTQFYGNLGSRIGNDIATAQNEQQQAQDQLSQAQTQRSAVSGVSLNEEATKLLQFQQAYQAAGKLVSVLDSLTQTTINIVSTS